MKYILAFVLAVFAFSAQAEAPKAPAKAVKKAAPAKKVETPPTSSVKPEIKKPTKQRAAPADVKKKAAAAQAH